MKLYAFTYSDKENLSESALLSRVQAFVESEAVLQDWAPGYMLKQSRTPEINGQGKIYYYEVIGRYLNSEGAPSHENEEQAFTLPPIPAAAPETSI